MEEIICKRYLDAFRELAQAEAYPYTEADMARLEKCIAGQDRGELADDTCQMRKRAGWINEIVERTQGWLEKHSDTHFEFRKVSWRGKIHDYDETGHRRFLSQCNNFSLEDGRHFYPSSFEFRTGEDKDGFLYRQWRKECNKLSPTRFEGEVRASDVIPPNHAILSHPTRWRSAEKALAAYQKGAPWEHRGEERAEKSPQPEGRRL